MSEYDKIMNYRERDPKGFALSRIEIKIDSLNKRARKSGRDEEWHKLYHDMINFCADMTNRYGLTADETMHCINTNLV